MLASARYLFLLGAFFALMGCKGEGHKEERVPSTVLKGRFSGFDEGVVKLKRRKGSFTYQEESIAKDSLEKGRFRMEFRKGELGFVSLEGPKEKVPLYLEAGDSLIFRKRMHGELHFEGDGASRNRYLQEEKAFKDSLGRVQDSLFKKNLSHFLEKLEERREAHKAFRKRSFKKEEGQLGQRFKKLIKARNRIEWVLMKFSFPDIYRYEHPNDSLELPSGYWDFMDTLDLNDSLLLGIPEYLSFAYDVANKYTLENKGEQKNKSYREILFQTILEEFKGKNRDALLTYFMLEQLRYDQKKLKQEFWDPYREHVEDTAMLHFVEKRMEEEKDPSS